MASENTFQQNKYRVSYVSPYNHWSKRYKNTTFIQLSFKHTHNILQHSVFVWRIWQFIEELWLDNDGQGKEGLAVNSTYNKSELWCFSVLIVCCFLCNAIVVAILQCSQIQDTENMCPMNINNTPLGCSFKKQSNIYLSTNSVTTWRATTW